MKTDLESVHADLESANLDLESAHFKLLSVHVESKLARSELELAHTELKMIDWIIETQESQIRRKHEASRLQKEHDGYAHELAEERKKL